MKCAAQLKELAKDVSVLYVEDEKHVREETVDFLKKFFLSVDAAKNGKEGVELFERHKHDMVITDIVMPVMEGEDMMAHIRAIEPDVPILVISAYDFSDFLVPKFPNGADAFLKKPVSYEILVQTLCDIIQKVKRADMEACGLQDDIKSLKDKIKTLEEEIALLKKSE